MGPQSAAMEVVLGNFEGDLDVSFFDSMTDIMELHKAIKTDGAKTRLRRVGVKFTAVLQAKSAEWHPLATRRGRLNEELRTRDASDHAAYVMMSDMNNPLNEYYVYDDGDFELRNLTTVELQTESDEIYKKIQALADVFGFDDGGGYDSEDPDYADGSLALAQCRVWAGL